jgi:hypothetical protein
MATPEQEMTTEFLKALGDFTTKLDSSDPQTTEILARLRSVLSEPPRPMVRVSEPSTPTSPSQEGQVSPRTPPRIASFKSLPFRKRESNPSPPRVTVHRSTLPPLPLARSALDTQAESHKLLEYQFESLTHKIVILPPDLADLAPYVIDILRYVVNERRYKQECLNALMEATAPAAAPPPPALSPPALSMAGDRAGGDRVQKPPKKAVRTHKYCRICRLSQPIEMFGRWSRRCNNCV